MKEFVDTFFDVNNFIVSKLKYEYSSDGKKEYHITYNVNDDFIPIMGASMISVLENNQDATLVFHIFTDGYSKENAKKIEEVAKKWNCTCIIYKLNMEPFHDFHIKVERFSRITYARLYMPKIVKEYTSRYIYLDADTMCVASLDKICILLCASALQSSYCP